MSNVPSPTHSQESLKLLLTRKSPICFSYLEQKEEKKSSFPESKKDLIKLVLFRVEGEWFGLGEKVFSLVANKKKVQRLPLRTGGSILGLVNIDGQLRIAVSLKQLLSLPKTDSSDLMGMQRRIYPRSIVIEKEREVWVFPVDEVWGIESFHQDELKSLPPDAAVKGSPFLKSVLEWKNIRVSVLDDELLFYSLKRQV